jgi:CHAD domain-containing protein
MSVGKWIRDIEAETPVPEAARRVLRKRLDVIKEHLDLVANGDQDPETVHQLRVSSRRTAAALEMFTDHLPPKVHARAKKKLKKLRRAAGAVRDWDVFLQFLHSRGISAKARGIGLNLVMGYALGQRRAARAQLDSVARGFSEKFPKFSKKVIAAVDHDVRKTRSQTLADLAPKSLLPLVRALVEAAGRDLTDPDKLHQVRIAGKRLRYAMEILAACFGPPFREQLYPAVEEMQEILGRANDSRFAMARLDELRDQMQKNTMPGKRNLAVLAELAAYHQRRLTRERQRFERWWQTWKKSESEGAITHLHHSAGS